MKTVSILIGIGLICPGGAVWGQGSGSHGKNELAAAAQSNQPQALAAYAEYLDRYGDSEASQVYNRLADARKGAGDTAGAAAAWRRAAILDLEAGRNEAAMREMAAAGGSPHFSEVSVQKWPTVNIPGPLRSFARMAALSPDSQPADILPALARNVVTNGYEASQNNEALEQTEYLKLVHRYISQAHELEKLSGESRVITVPNCESPVVADLVRILGFRYAAPLIHNPSLSLTHT